ncbi:hypothetical protein C8R48DRAFT_674635 [Suillus tomentosus]|nr:hypothetical protein C8R48DRAFT_674635 [Suillus tomentosus]
MSQLSDLSIPDNAQLIVGAVTRLGVIGAIAQAYLPQLTNGLHLPPSLSTWRLRGRIASEVPHTNSTIFALKRRLWPTNNPLLVCVPSSLRLRDGDLLLPMENYYIPAGTTVFGNTYAICRDLEVFPEPDAFKP